MKSLDKLRDVIIQSPRNQTARLILEYLEDGNEEAAKNIYHWDGDKIHSNDLIYSAVEELLGLQAT